MTGRKKIIRGVTAPVGVALPKISPNDTTDKILAGIVDDAGASRLISDIYPPEFDVATGYTMFGKDRGNGKVVSAKRSAVTRVASEPLFNDLPAFSFTDGSGDTAGLSGDLSEQVSMPASWSWFVVATIDPSLKTTPAVARLMYQIDVQPVSTRCYLGMQANGNLVMGPSPADSNVSAVIQAVNVPAANVPFIVCGVYNAATQKTHIYLNSVGMQDACNSTVAIAAENNDVLGIGGPAGYNAAQGWKGKIARALTYTGALSDAQITTVFDALYAKYIA